FAVDLDGAFVAADDTETDGQTHSRARLAFGRKERIEKTLLHFRRHAGAGICDADHHAVADFLCGDAHFAAGRHRVHRVVNHVHEYFAEFYWVTLYEGFAVGVESEAYWSEFRPRLPAWARHFAGIFEELRDGYSFKLTARALACEVLNTSNDMGAVF